MAARPIANKDLCEVKVTTLRDQVYKEPLLDREVQILTKRRNHYIHLIRGVTDVYGSICLQVPCGYKHIISSRHLKSSPNQPLPSFFSHVDDHVTGTLQFTSPRGAEITTGDGPVHLYSAQTCRRGSGSGKYQFEFVLDGGAGADMGSFMPVELRPQMELSWAYQPEDSYEHSACTLRLLFTEPVQEDRERRVFAISRLNNKKGHLLGTYISRTLANQDASGSAFVCLRVRCPSLQANGIHQAIHVTIHVASNTHELHCHITVPRQSPLQLDKDLSSGFVINPPGLPGYGFFRSNRRRKTSTQWAMYNCRKSSEAAANLNCRKDP